MPAIHTVTKGMVEMADKVIHEVRLVETEDGFRIEIKGDKERIRKFFSERGKHGGFPFGWAAHHGSGRGFGCGPFGHFGHFGPWWQGGPEPDEEPTPKV